MSDRAAANVDIADGVYLRACLEPLRDVLARPDVTDVYINRPFELWVETLGGRLERFEDPNLDELTLWRLARQVAALAHQGVSREHPLLSAKLPDGARIQVVAPPATRGPLAISIRRQASARLELSDYVRSGAFDDTSSGALEDRTKPTPSIRPVEPRDFGDALAEAVRSRRNILVSGGTSTGKTTFLNALLREIPLEERLILIEDTPELEIDQPNSVGLVAVRGELGETQVTATDLVSASMRMRPDRIILGELRGPEALAFLRAVNSGHPGSMTTVHADSPASAVEQLVLLVLQAGTALGRDDVRHYVQQSIDVFVQLSRRSGRRQVEQVLFSNRWQ